MISDLWEPIGTYIKRIDGPMPVVHHYTNVAGALSILARGCIWFTERAHLNDSSEISHGVEIARRIFCEQDRKSDAINLRREANRVFEDLRFFSASFSFKGNQLSQWRDYADAGRGVVLSFKASAFKDPKAHIDSLIAGNPTAFVCPMSYSSADLRAVVARIIERWDGRNISELCDHIFMISSMFKDASWEAEREHRFFVHHARDTILRDDHHRIRERNGQLISYLELPIRNWKSVDDFPIHRICLGPAAPDNLEAQFSDFVFSKGLPIRDIGRFDKCLLPL